MWEVVTRVVRMMGVEVERLLESRMAVNELNLRAERRARQGSCTVACRVQDPGVMLTKFETKSNRVRGSCHAQGHAGSGWGRRLRWHCSLELALRQRAGRDPDWSWRSRMLCLRDAHSGRDDGAAHSPRCPQSNRS